MSLLSFFSGAASAFNESKDKEREALAKEKEEAAKRAAELETYRSKKEIEAEFSPDKNKFVTAEQRALIEAEEEKTNRYSSMGYGIFFTPTGANKYEVSYKELKKDKDAEKLFPDMAAVNVHLEGLRKTAKENNLGEPEINVTNTGKGFKVESKFKPTGSAGGEFTTLEQANNEVGNIQATINQDPLRKGKFIAKTERTKEGKYTVSVVQDPAYKSDGAAGPGVSPIGRKYDFDFLPLSSNVMGPDELKSRAGKYRLVPLSDTNIPRFGSDQEQYREGYGRDWTMVYTAGTGETPADRLEDHSRMFNNRMPKEFVEKLNDVATKYGGRAAQGITEFENSLRSFVSLYEGTQKDPLKDEIVQVPIYKKHKWLSNYIGINDSIDEIILGDRTGNPFKGTKLEKLLPINEPQYTNADGNRATPINPHFAEAFAPKSMTPDGTPVRKYDDTVFNYTRNVAMKSGVHQARVHTLFNNATDANGNQGAEQARRAYNRHIEASGVLSRASRPIVVDDKGVGHYSVPTLMPQEKATVMAAIESVPDFSSRILMTQSLLDTQDALAGVTSQGKTANPSARFTKVTGGDEKKWRDLTDQLSVANEITTNTQQMKALLLDGAPVGVPLTLERLKGGAQAMLNYMINDNTFNVAEGSKITKNELINNLQKELNDATGDTARAALVNLLGTMLSYQAARLMDPNGRLSDQDRSVIQGALGFDGIFANPIAALNVIEALETRSKYVSAVNTSLTTGTSEEMLAAYTYHNLSGGDAVQGNFVSNFTKMFGVKTGAKAPTATSEEDDPLSPNYKGATPQGTTPSTGTTPATTSSRSAVKKG